MIGPDETWSCMTLFGHSYDGEFRTSHARHFFKRTGIKALAWPLRGIYAVFKLFPSQNRVVFISRQSDRPSRDFLMLAEEIRRQNPHLEIVMLCRTMDGSFLSSLSYLFEIVRQARHLAVASACIVDGYVIPVSMLNHKPGLYIIQTWHALGAIKKFGYQSLDHPDGRSSSLADAMRMHHNYDMILCGTAAMVPVFAEAFGADPKRVAPLGLPRVDYLLSGDAQRNSNPAAPLSPSIRALSERFPRLTDRSKQTILYAPTYRRGRSVPLQDVIDACRDNRFTLIVKPHTLESATIRESHVVDATGTSILDLLLISDVVITDYSAVAFEASVVHRPLYFYVPDIDSYVHETGLNIDPLKAAPDISSRDIADIIEWIETGDRDHLARQALDQYMEPFPEESCTRRIVNIVTAHVSGVEDHGTIN